MSTYNPCKCYWRFSSEVQLPCLLFSLFSQQVPCHSDQSVNVWTRFLSFLSLTLLNVLHHKNEFWSLWYDQGPTVMVAISVMSLGVWCGLCSWRRHVPPLAPARYGRSVVS